MGPLTRGDIRLTRPWAAMLETEPEMGPGGQRVCLSGLFVFNDLGPLSVRSLVGAVRPGPEPPPPTRLALVTV